MLRETPRGSLVVETTKAPSARRGNVYARLSAFRRRSTRDATRRRASPASACVASPDAKTAKKPDTPAELNARATVRKAVAVTTKREAAHRVPRGVAGSCHRLLDHCDILMLYDLTASSKGSWLPGAPGYQATPLQWLDEFRIGLISNWKRSHIYELANIKK